MAAPKSVVKIDKDGVHYTSSVDQASYYMHELSRAAMRDVGKYVKKEWQRVYDANFQKHTKRGRKTTKYSVVAGKKTLYPRVQIGLKAGDDQAGWYAYQQEFGSSRVPRMGMLTHAVKDNIPKIIEIESQYLSGLSGEASRLASMVHEDDMEG